MFTGIITDIGFVRKIEKRGDTRLNSRPLLIPLKSLLGRRLPVMVRA